MTKGAARPVVQVPGSVQPACLGWGWPQVSSLPHYRPLQLPESPGLQVGGKLID